MAISGYVNNIFLEITTLAWSVLQAKALVRNLRLYDVKKEFFFLQSTAGETACQTNPTLVIICRNQPINNQHNGSQDQTVVSQRLR